MSGTIRPLRDLVYVEKIPRLMSEGGIHIPQAFKARGPGSRLQGVQDFFHAKVLAVGPEAQRDVAVGDEALVYTFAEGDGTTLYTGDSVGERNRMFVKYPGDFVCVLQTSKAAAE